MDKENEEIIEVEKVEQESNVAEKKVEAKEKNQEEPKKRKKGLCIASMVLGIIALVLFCIWYISIPCGILSIIFGALGVKTVDRGMAIAGIVTGAIGLFISFCIVMALFTFGFALGIMDEIDDIDYDVKHKNYNTYYDRDYDLFD